MTRDKKFFLGLFSFMSGIFLFPYFKMSLWVLFLVAGCAIACTSMFPSERGKVAALIILCAVVGFIRFSFCKSLNAVDVELRNYTNKKVDLQCEIAKMPEIRNGKQQVVLAVKDKNFPDGRILAFTDAYGDYDYGDVVRFSGTLKIPENFEGFDYRKYLFSQDIYFTAYYPKMQIIRQDNGGLYGKIYEFRKLADGNITKIMPSPQANILSAMVLGMNSDEAKGIMDEFNKTGTSHIIVVSGSHLVIIIAILLNLFLGAGISRNKIIYFIILGIAGFIILSGSATAAIRSGIMASIFLLAVRIGRPKHALNALMFSAAAMIFMNPHILSGDVSFQLSFLATFGVVYILPKLKKRFDKFSEYGGIKEILLTTFAAQLATLPIIVMNFGQFSFLSFLANVLILPVVPALMVGGFLLVGVSFANLTLAKVLSWPICIMISYQLAVVHYLASTDIGLVIFKTK